VSISGPQYQSNESSSTRSGSNPPAPSSPEPIDVLRRAEAPAHFLWHGRLYTVREVIGHWVESGEWWHAALTRALRLSAGAALPAPPVRAEAGGAASTVALARPAETAWAVTDETDVSVAQPGTVMVGGRPQRRVLAGRLAGVSEDESAYAVPSVPVRPEADVDQEIWRVEASMGRSGIPAQYDLSLDLGTGLWSLSTV